METLPKKPSRNTAETKQNLSGDRCCRLVHRRVIAQESRQFRSKVGEDRSRPAGLPAVSSRSRAGWRPPVGPRVPCRSCACLQQPLLPAALCIPVAETKLHRGGGSQGLGPTRAARPLAARGTRCRPSPPEEWPRFRCKALLWIRHSPQVLGF